MCEFTSRLPTPQGALEALKLSQELLLRIHRQRQGHDKDAAVPVADSRPQDTAAPSQPTAAEPDQDHLQPDAIAAGGVGGPGAPGGAAAAAAAREGERSGGSPTDAHVHELAAQASKLRGMSGNLKRLLEATAGEVQGALEDTRDSLGVAAAAAATAAAATATAAAGTQTEGDLSFTRESVDALEEELRRATAAAGALEAEKSRLDGELGKAAGELSKVQGLLREKTAEVCSWPSYSGRRRFSVSFADSFCSRDPYVVTWVPPVFRSTMYADFFTVIFERCDSLRNLFFSSKWIPYHLSGPFVENIAHKNTQQVV